MPFLALAFQNILHPIASFLDLWARGFIVGPDPDGPAWHFRTLGDTLFGVKFGHLDDLFEDIGIVDSGYPAVCFAQLVVHQRVEFECVAEDLADSLHVLVMRVVQPRHFDDLQPRLFGLLLVEEFLLELVLIQLHKVIVHRYVFGRGPR